MKKEIWMVVILVLVATVSSGVLGFVNVTTRPIIKRNEVRKLRESVLESVNVQFEADNLVNKFESEFRAEELGGKDIYFRYDDEGNLTGVTFEISGSGFQGPITAIISLKPDLETIVGLEILDHQETPGLGARITDEDFLRQFNGKIVRPEILVVTDAGDEENKVDAITGATRTSKAIQGIINDTLSEVQTNILTDKVMERFSHE
ncbi:MAG: RnfABCDGE type electron transport complex subunit G [Candidatus Bipolaricaulota bacterium]|nr:RnfABCDGE type electron transport complex subunit G [Candidatus Bipolaricaulota bacterium]MBS3792387.1 RnfABCDGE type electron transport complex subunit G [Candidatus Bipolaricaulota bacterium]